VDTSIDLNADLGEKSESAHSGDQDAILRVVTTAHVACGFHAGGPQLMRDTVETALRHGVAVGAHPSYLDREGFGRRPLDVGLGRIRTELLYQVGALDAITRSLGGRVSSVKPHGALYNRMAGDPACAAAIATALREYRDDLWLVAPAGSVGAAVSRDCGVRVAEEAFCDRGYLPGGALVPREREGAVIEDTELAAARALRLVFDREVEDIDGGPIGISPSTLCVHGDTPGAASLAAVVRARLEAAGCRVRAFAAAR